MAFLLPKSNPIPTAVFCLIILPTVLFFTVRGLANECDGIGRRFGEVKQSWRDGELFILIRHTEKCASVEHGCPPGDASLTNEGIHQAKLIGDALREFDFSNTDVFYSPTPRTAMTAKIAMLGPVLPLDWLADGCKHAMLKKIKGQKRPGMNLVLVTHSSCLNALEDEYQKQIINFDSGRKAYFGVSVLFHMAEDERVDVFGCILPVQWKQVSDFGT